jgi:hypothetical protein
MKFSPADRRAAAKFGLRIGESIAQVDQALAWRGWAIDQDWLRAEEAKAIPQPAGAQMICGDGVDATCNKAFKRHRRRLYLTFDKNDDALIDVATKLP